MKRLSSRERMLKAMSLEQPDRMPLMCQFSYGFMLQQLNVSPLEFWFDAEIFAAGLIELRRVFNFDGILVSLHGHSEGWRPGIRNMEQDAGAGTALFSGVKMEFTGYDLPTVSNSVGAVPKAISEIYPEHISDVIDYIPVSTDLHFEIDPAYPFTVFDILHNKVNDEFSIHGEVTSPFDYLLDLLGYEQGLLALIENPEKCLFILQKYTDGLVSLVHGMCRKNIDAVKISSPFAGMGFISPGLYKKYVMPFESQIVKAVKKNGKFAYVHTCGLIDDRLELMRDTGVSGIECLDPPPIGNVELKDAVKRIGNDSFIKGNIDSVNTLLYGTDDEVIRDVIERMKAGKKAKGFILSTACSIAPSVSRERIEILFKLVEKYGAYE